ncbi:MAG TPA: glycosyltransferase family 4 protein [Candidatus Saccharimonadales bacterium]|nr:glycosyltransferase family 4 protein [Candidatus Saccharimonadales bacterium]
MYKKQVIISSYDDLKNPYFAGGGAHAVHSVAKRLASSKYAVTVITGRYPGSKNESIEGVTYQRTGTSFLGAQLDQLTFQFCLPFHVITKRFDCWIESFTPPFSTTFLQLFTRKPVIGLVHMLSGEDMKRKYIFPFDLIEKIGLKTYKTIIVTSTTIKHKIQAINTKAKIVVISNGIEKIYVGKTNQREHILFLGRIEVNQKGIDLLLNAYAKIVNKIKYPLYLAGSGEKKEEAKLDRLMEVHAISKKIKRLGRVNDEEKETLYQNALFVVIPSRFETFSSVALEAMAHGRAIVCFDIDGLKWIPKNSSIKIKPFDEALFANAILTLVKDTKKTKEIGIAGQEYAKKLTWENITEEYEKVILSVL